MVFSSVPVYLDPPNWNQHQEHQQYHHPPGGSSAGIIGSEIHQFTQGLTATPLLPEAASMATAGSVRPGSMSDRAKLAKLPQPEQGLKCPRCDSANTKFCYFNNYSLSQPRHFCKTCRRYWTRGGALRNVPVGGGCRRNKRSKSSGSSSKSAATASSAGGGTSSSSSTATGGGGGFGAITNSSFTAPSQLSFMASLHHPLTDHYGAASNLGLSFAGISPIDSLEYQMSGSNSGIGLEQWRQAQQFPFLGGLGLESQQQPPPPLPTRQPASGLYSFETDGGGSNELVSQILPKVSGAGLLTQQFTSSVKMEDANAQGLNLSRQYVGLHANDQYWGGSVGGGGPSSSTTGTGGWTGNLPNFNS